jgi:hypothetical protein
MALEEILVSFFVLLTAFAAIRAVRTRHTRHKAERSSRELAVSPLSGLVLGAMLTGFQAILQPESRPPITEEQREEGLDRQSDCEPPDGWLLAEQLRQVRRGNDVEKLTVRASSSSNQDTFRKQ